jgi:hypothetical protein
VSRVRGDIPGLLRPGAPVIAPDWRARDRPLLSAIYAYTWVGSERGGFVFHHYIEPWTDGTPRDRTVGYQASHAELFLDLTDPTGMDHGARWLAEKVGLANLNGTAPMWRRSGAWWRLDTWDDEMDFGSGPETYENDTKTRHVPGISTLTDPAEALALAIAHVAGSGS